MFQHLKKSAIVIVIVCAVFFLGQIGLRWGTNAYLREGAKIPVRLGKLFINPATSAVTLELQGNKPGQILLLDLGRVRFDWWTIFRKRLRLGRIAFTGLHFNIERRPNGQLSVGEIPLNNGKTTTPAPAATPQGKPWGVGIGELDLNNVQILYRDPALNLNIEIHHFHLGAAESWNANSWTPFEGNFGINGGRLIIKGKCRPFRPAPDVVADVDLTNLPLSWLSPALKTSGLDKIEGTLTVRANINGSYEPLQPELHAGFDGTISLNDFVAAGPCLAKREPGFSGKIVVHNLEVGQSGSEPYQLWGDGLEIPPESRATLVDRSVKPAFRCHLSPFALKVTGFDSRKPGKLSALELTVQPARHERIQLKGKWALFSAVPNGQVKLTIDDLNLEILNPYVQHAIGQRITSGLFDLKTDGTLKQGELNATNGLVARKLYFEKLNTAELDPTDQQLGLPLNLCLSLIRDSEENIRLDVPMEGNFADPNVPKSKLIWTLAGRALIGALRNAAMAFFPSGNKVAYDPILFKPGKATLSQDAESYLAKVTEKLRQKPGLTLKISGLATSTDRQAMFGTKPDSQKITDKLMDLAKERSEALKNHLTEKLGFNPQRLLEAPPAIDPNANAPPRAELSL